MNNTILLSAMIILWLIVIASSYQRLYTMPRWFSNPPASFERIRRQSKASQLFWLPVTTLSLISLIASLIVYWNYANLRLYICAALACFVINGVSTGVYFVKEILIFARMQPDEPQTAELLNRTSIWLKWTTARNVLQTVSAVCVTIAYQHAVH